MVSLGFCTKVPKENDQTPPFARFVVTERKLTGSRFSYSLNFIHITTKMVPNPKFSLIARLSCGAGLIM